VGEEGERERENFFFLRFYLFERERKRDHEQGGRAEGEAVFLLNREPDVGLDPRTLGS